jgi:drug/metabolite transporter (DMT)-like permease
MTRRGWALFLAVGVIWGLPYLLIRVSMREVTPAFLVFVRTGGGALLLAPFVARRGALAPLLSRWKALVAFTVVELAVPWWVLSNAEKRITSSLAGLLVAAVPIAGALIGRLTGTDRLDRTRAAGLLLRGGRRRGAGRLRRR